jgi:hypothetical protein
VAGSIAAGGLSRSDSTIEMLVYPGVNGRTLALSSEFLIASHAGYLAWNAGSV